MKQQHHPIDLKTYQSGIDSDSNKEVLGSSEQGTYVDALNMRNMSMDGDNSAVKKIKGEEVLYENIDNRCDGGTGAPLPGTYECMLTLEVNNNIVEVWATSDPILYPSLIRINGKIVLMSSDFPVDSTMTLQYDKNESCIGGEIYITNNVTPPMVFSIKDLIDNSGVVDCTQKYFSEFNINEYTIQSTGTLFKPMFIKQTSVLSSSSYDVVFGSAGLAVGSYSYSYRYVTEEGDRTSFSPITELIPVVRNNSSQFDPYFPNLKTIGSEPNLVSTTVYGNHIRIKYDNSSNFSFIEVRRDSWYAGEPLDLPPISEIIGSFALSAGLNIVDLLDRVEPSATGSEILSDEDTFNQDSSVERAKAIRYFNERLYLMNIGYKSKDIQEDVTFVDDSFPMFPVIHKLGKKGHKHPYNAAMYKSNMRGEKNSFAVVLSDDKNNASYAVEIPGNAINFQFPNRRDEISSDTQGISYFGTVYAANTDGSITQTHEVFDHYDAIRKTDYTGGTGDDGLISFKENDPYNTLNPTSQVDTSSDLGYRINDEVGMNYTTSIEYNPKAFGIDYYSQGIAFKGLDSYPSNYSDGFSVVQTAPAMRVLAQGLGFYEMIEAESILSTDSAKGENSFWAYFPDLEILYPDTYQDFINNPNSYKIQLVSPLGYWSEVYTHTSVAAERDKGADMIVRPMILRDGINYDEVPNLADFNPGLSTAGQSGLNETTASTDYDYVAFGRYQNNGTPPYNYSPAFGSSYGNGNTLFDVVDVSDVTTYSGRQGYVRVEIAEEGTGNYHYATRGMNSESATNLAADSQGVRNWKEPMYVINLVRNVDVSSGLTTEYKYGSSYVKFNSLILESDGTPSQSAPLVSERWEDCIPSINGEVNNAYSSLYRFVYVVDNQGNERRWLNVSFESFATISAILINIQTNGFDTVTDASGSYNIYGVYSSSETIDDLCTIFSINFDQSSVFPAFPDETIPPSGSKVYVKYDNRIPVRVFGGDTYINESVWAVLDNETGNNGEAVDNQSRFRCNSPLPYKSYKYQDSYRVWKDSDFIGGHLYSQLDNFHFSDNFGAFPCEIRQLITMWTAETRANLSFAFNNESPDKANSDQFYPLVNYIPRPHFWQQGSEDNRTVFENNNHLNPLYYDDYGSEWDLWKYGGFRFTPQTNIDYSKNQSTLSYTTVPTLGFNEQIDFCTRILWSEKRPINAQNTPTVKTFPPSNYFDISDDTGEIKFAWSALSSDKGNNLYALTNSGICLLLVDKRVIHEINADELATVGSDIGGILNQLWIDKTIGMNDETWRSWAEYSNMLFFVNTVSAYLFTDNQIVDIAKSGFFELLDRKFLPISQDGNNGILCGGYNVKNNEYIFNASVLKPLPQSSTMIYGVEQKMLQCQSSYNFEKYLYLDNKLYGMKGLKTYELGVGNLIGGKTYPCYVSNVSDKDVYSDKEFIRIRVNSNVKPERIYFYDNFEEYKADNYSSVVDAVVNPISIKDYFGYECYIPRKYVAPNNRQQGRAMIFKIESSEDESFTVVSTGVQYKMLK